MTDDVAGRLVVTLDLAGVVDKAGFMERCVRALDLPDWFGRNWDALADSLTDLSVWPEAAAGRGLLVVVTGWQTYAKARPDEWETAREVLSEAVDRTPRLSVALALGGSHQTPSHLPG
ncbi:barstar family protein [Streptomyces sporangiiformans]|uniref:Barstar family protein n=1 Tax=Streptomyces sporangiiformans TaxID=2315329 RepID=A0A505CWQ0_9ACTN|nr:barstar family protein [Streptomyces sporangiiformans]TPQ15994.1 barstar family protein [Streptomyces sporangiiformans]